MRRLPTGLISIALVLPGCGTQAPRLPDDLVERAAMCGVAASRGERGADMNKLLTLKTQSEILRFALLAGETRQGYSPVGTGEALGRLGEMEKTLDPATDAKALGALCAEAFPRTTAQPALPADPLEASAQCWMVSRFVSGSLAGMAVIEDKRPVYAAIATQAHDAARRLAKQRGLDGAGFFALQRDAAFNAARATDPVTLLELCATRVT